MQAVPWYLTYALAVVCITVGVLAGQLIFKGFRGGVDWTKWKLEDDEK